MFFAGGKSDSWRKDPREESLPGAWRLSDSSYGHGPPSEDDYRQLRDRERHEPYRSDSHHGHDRREPDYDRPGYRPSSSNVSDRKRVAEPSFYTNKMPRVESAPVRMASGAEILFDETRRCMNEMAQELSVIESSPELKFLPHTSRIVKDEISNIQTNTNSDWLDVESDRFQVRVYKRVLLPPTRPGCNVVGKLMGVGGKTLRSLCQTYRCHISINGAGSRKNHREEEELLQSGDPKYSHFNCPLNAEISTTGPAHLAYSRLADVLTILHLICTTDEAFEYNGLRFEATNPIHKEDKYALYEGEDDDRRAGDDYRGRSEDGSSHQKDSDGYQSDRHSGSYREREESRHADRGGRGGRRGGGFVPRGSRGTGRGFVPRRE